MTYITQGVIILRNIIVFCLYFASLLACPAIIAVYWCAIPAVCMLAGLNDGIAFVLSFAAYLVYLALAWRPMLKVFYAVERWSENWAKRNLNWNYSLDL